MPSVKPLLVALLDYDGKLFAQLPVPRSDAHSFQGYMTLGATQSGGGRLGVCLEFTTIVFHLRQKEVGHLRKMVAAEKKL